MARLCRSALRSTKILTANGALVTVPNSEVLTHVIFNANAGVAECMVSVDVAVPDGSDPDDCSESAAK